MNVLSLYFGAGVGRTAGVLSLISAFKVQLSIDRFQKVLLAANTDSCPHTTMRQLRKQRFLTVMLSGPTAVVRDRPLQRRLTYRKGKVWSIQKKIDDWCLEFLGFSRRQICELSVLLDIPDRFHGRYRAAPSTALAVICYRLAWPMRLQDCVEEFGRERGWLSTAFNAVCVHLYDVFYQKLQWDERVLTPVRFEHYCQRIQERGEPSGMVWGFMDGTHKSICRPRPDTADQELFYSGHKHDHTMQFLAIVTPDGLIASIYGPFEGRCGDWAMFKECGLQDRILSSAHDTSGDQLYIYGDKAFYLEEDVIGAYRAKRNVSLSAAESIFNAYMAKQRMAVEWGFGKVTQYFEFTNLRKNLKIGLSPTAAYYFTSVLLMNCHTCYSGSKTGRSFDCAAPDIFFYFNCSDIEKNALNMYINEFLTDPVALEGNGLEAENSELEQL